ncbi:peptidoglycan DD-metalloendopeptidase family protein [Candidatus Omnitrophota bacterium]
MKKIAWLIMTSIILGGCASTPNQQVITTTPIRSPKVDGVYHTTLRGQTLWRIAKAYNVDVREIMDANTIVDASKIDKGQLIFIPGAEATIRERIDLSTPSQSRKGYIWPVKGKIVSYFGSQRDNARNKGIDISAEEGKVIVASRSGKVVFCDNKVKGLGKALIVDHNDGYSTLYAHNSENLVTCGDYVKQNQPIAKVGSTGRTANSILHFQVRKGHKPENPFYYLP